MRHKLIPIAAFALLAIGAGSPPASAPRLRLMPTAITGPDGGWDYVSVDPSTHRVYIARTDGVDVIDTRTNSLVAHALPAQRFHGVAPLPGGVSIASASKPALAFVLDADGKVLHQATVGVKPDAVLREPRTGLVAVMDNENGVISLVDPATAMVKRTIMVGGALESAVSDGKGRMYVNIEDKNALVEVDVLAGKVLRRLPLVDCDAPTALGLDTALGQLVTTCGNGSARVIDAVRMTDVAKLPIGPGPDQLAVDSERHLAFVPTGRDGRLTAIALGAKPALAGSIATAKGARTGAYDPTTGRMYLPTADYAVATAPGQRPQPVPGSFRVLVVETR